MKALTQYCDENNYCRIFATHKVPFAVDTYNTPFTLERMLSGIADVKGGGYRENELPLRRRNQEGHGVRKMAHELQGEHFRSAEILLPARPSGSVRESWSRRGRPSVRRAVCSGVRESRGADYSLARYKCNYD